MNHYISMLACTALLSLLVHAAPANLIITEIMANTTNGGGALNGDWFEIYNNGTETINMTGYSWDDDSAVAGTTSFGALTSLAPGAVALVVDESSVNIADWTASWMYASSATVIDSSQLSGGFVGLSASGDTLNIFDSANQLVTSVTFGTSVKGSSFAWDATGASLGASEVGTALAYAQGGGGLDISSAGLVAVPEPATFSLFALALFGTCWFRSRRR